MGAQLECWMMPCLALLATGHLGQDSGFVNPTPRRCATRLVSCNTRDVFEAVSEARQLIRIVADDSGLPSYARRAAAGLEPLAASRPAVVLDRLEDLRRQVVPDLPSWPPTCDYARCVPVDTFWDYHI